MVHHVQQAGRRRLALHVGPVPRRDEHDLAVGQQHRADVDAMFSCQKPLQLFTRGGQLRSIHAASNTRLFNADLLALIQEFAVGFEPPKGLNGATGLPLAIEHGRKSGYRRKQHFQHQNGESKEQPIVTRRRNRPNPTRKSHPTKLFFANFFAGLVVA